MSRQIDISKPLSKADRQYLQDRGRLPEDVEPVTDDDDASDSSPADEGEDVAYEDMSKDALQAECAERELPTSGNKETLIARLVEDDESEDEDDEADEA